MESPVDNLFFFSFFFDAFLSGLGCFNCIPMVVGLSIDSWDVSLARLELLWGAREMEMPMELVTFFGKGVVFLGSILGSVLGGGGRGTSLSLDPMGSEGEGRNRLVRTVKDKITNIPTIKRNK